MSEQRRPLSARADLAALRALTAAADLDLEDDDLSLLMPWYLELSKRQSGLRDAALRLATDVEPLFSTMVDDRPSAVE